MVVFKVSNIFIVRFFVVVYDKCVIVLISEVSVIIIGIIIDEIYISFWKNNIKK